MRVILLYLLLMLSLLSACTADNGQHISVKSLDSCEGRHESKIGDYNPDKDKMFLIIGLSIENSGYPSFDVSPSVFGVEIDNVVYPYSYATFSLDTAMSLPHLGEVTLNNGGKTSGYIAFNVPKSFNGTYVVIYNGWEKVKPDIRIECS